MFAFIGVDQLIEKSTESLSLFLFFPSGKAAGWKGAYEGVRPGFLVLFVGNIFPLGCMQ